MRLNKSSKVHILTLMYDLQVFAWRPAAVSLFFDLFQNLFAKTFIVSGYRRKGQCRCPHKISPRPSARLGIMEYTINHLDKEFFSFALKTRLDSWILAAAPSGAIRLIVSKTRLFDNNESTAYLTKNSFFRPSLNASFLNWMESSKPSKSNGLVTWFIPTGYPKADGQAHLRFRIDLTLVLTRVWHVHPSDPQAPEVPRAVRVHGFESAVAGEGVPARRQDMEVSAPYPRHLQRIISI